MPAGLEIWDESGLLMVSLTSRITRTIGRITTSSNGSQVIPEFLEGDPWFCVMPNTNVPLIRRPVVRLQSDGMTLAWSYPANNPSFPTDIAQVNIIYGVW